MRLLILTTAIVCMATAILRADEHFVSLSGTNDTTGGYTNWAGAATQIQWAVNAAATGEKVWVSNGSYRVTNQIMVANQITVQSVNGYSNTTVYADWPAYTTRCFFVSNAIVDGFTITNGHSYNAADPDGGGAKIITNSIMRNCYFTKNVAAANSYYSGGGGVYMESGCIMTNCWFVANDSQSAGSQSGKGGGVKVGGGQLFNCAVISNTSVYHGGGIYDTGGATIISNCNISFNRCQLPAGGVWLGGGTLIDCVISNNQSISGNYNNGGGISGAGNIINCVIVNNNTTDGTTMSTHDGGGLNLGSPSYVSNCIIANNKSQDHGGGLTIAGGAGDIQVVACRIYNNICLYGDGGGVKMSSGGQIRNSLIYNNTNSSVTNFGGGVCLTNAAVITNQLYGLINCTIVSNYSANEGGGIAAGGSSNYIVNCIIANNTSLSNSYPDVYNTGVNSNNYWYCRTNPTNAPLAPNQGNITNNPLFVDASTANYHLSANSPCINTGTNQNWMTNAVDLDGRARIRYGTVDMGAYERIYEGTIYGFR